MLGVWWLEKADRAYVREGRELRFLEWNGVTQTARGIPLDREF